MNLSYFKSWSGNLFFFNPRSLHEVRAAYDAAMATQEVVSMYTVPSMSGPWDKLPVIGHRPRTMILKDLGSPESSEEREALELELDSLARRFSASGRTLPLSAVAA